MTDRINECASEHKNKMIKGQHLAHGLPFAASAINEKQRRKDRLNIIYL